MQMNKQLLSGIIPEWNLTDATKYNVMGEEYLRH